MKDKTTVKLSKDSKFPKLVVPVTIARKVGRKWYLHTECATAYDGGWALIAKSTVIKGLAYPKEHCGHVYISNGNVEMSYLPLFPDRITTADGKIIASPEIAISMGYCFYRGNWKYLESNSGYHEMSRVHADTISEYSIGIEVEKVDSTLLHAHKALQLYDNFKWAKERDGSLGDQGFELVSPIYALEKDTIEVDVNTSPLKELINARADNRCGGHINLGCINCNTVTLFKRFQYVYPLLYAMYPERMTNRYCEAKPNHRYVGGDINKYSAILIKPYALEFRIFPAIKDVSDLLWRLRFMRHLVSRDLSEEAIAADLETDSELLNLLKGAFSKSKIEHIQTNYKPLTKAYVHSHS